MPEDILDEKKIIKMLRGANSVRDRAIIALLFDSGVRAGELLTMKKKDLDLSSEIAHITVSGKTGMRRIHDNGDFAFTPSRKDSFDAGELKAKGKSIWDFERLTVYECQTNAIKDEIEKGILHQRPNGASLVWVASTGDVINEIKQLLVAGLSI